MSKDRTNYYDNLLGKCKAVYQDEMDCCIYEKANENPEDWIVLIDRDVDVAPFSHTCK